MHVHHGHVLVQVFTDGLTNKLVGGWREGREEEVVLVRVYGEDTDKYIDRGAEVRCDWATPLGGQHAAPGAGRGRRPAVRHLHQRALV